ncbi:hypothetical protein Tco_1288081 [Tanacetum coccineum]
MGDEFISTTPERENDEFINSSVDDFVPILRKSEVTSVSIDLECGMPIDTPPSPYLVVLGDEKIDLVLRDELDTLLTGERKIDFNPCNFDSMSRSIKTSDLILEELTTKIGQDDSIPTEIDNGYYDSEGEKTRVMEAPSFGFHHMPSPRPAAYSPTEVMYCYYHPHPGTEPGF